MNLLSFYIIHLIVTPKANLHSIYTDLKADATKEEIRNVILSTIHYDGKKDGRDMAISDVIFLAVEDTSKIPELVYLEYQTGQEDLELLNYYPYIHIEGEYNWAPDSNVWYGG
jgi:regulator of PEP synthase PpsR (kinase-PPPase family)